MGNIWTLQLRPELRSSVEQNVKKIDLRLETNGNAQLIADMMRYQKDDRLTLEFGGKAKITTRITAPTTQKPLGELTDEEIENIVGLLRLTRTQLMKAMQGLYPAIAVNDKTVGYLAHFTR